MDQQNLVNELGDSLSTFIGKRRTKDMKHELKGFNLQTIAAAINNFSTTNKLGEGGFGPVYKGSSLLQGKLPDGQVIAVKRLSGGTSQGIVEFKNEDKVIAKPQHTNLVRLIGCSLHGAERILWFLRSNRSAEGSYRLGLGMDPNITNKLVIWKNDKVVWTSTIWLNGSLQSDIRRSEDDVNFYYTGIFDYQFYNFSYTSNEQERYLTYSVNEDVTSFPALTIDSAGVESMVNRQKLLRELGHNVSLPTIFGNRKTQARSDQTVKRDLKIFDFQTIAVATDNFSPANRLGQGGFGPVYKGKLQDEQEIAIKRLSKSSGQGIVEFKNEAKLIAKLQHTNLVRLLGCSLQGGERLLVYEYLPNKSLDFFIFDSSRKSLLDWKKRFSIIEGITQGLLYLHKYSRLRVIHRDLKVSNILLDEQMNPKISDFGMARTFTMNELEANTNRIVGTHGYMSPEYVMNGIVSMKSDVYSFGVLVLEIISSKKNNGSYDTERPLNLVGYLMDPTLDESCSPDEVIRCIHVGLLCVQDRAADRPTMSDVGSMLTNDTMALSKPKQPAFYINISSDYEEPEVTEIKLEVCSVNDVTISRMEGR
ncbi:hypothetical protein CUMW_132390, partial [Citrus unshiu]